MKWILADATILIVQMRNLSPGELNHLPEVLVAELGFNSGVSGFYLEPRVCR